MSNLLLQDRGFKAFKDVESLRDSLKQDNTRSVSVDNKSSLKFSQNTSNNLVLEVSGNKFAFTSSGFDNFCKLFKVPPRFLKELPYDNIVKDLTASIIKSKLEKFSLVTRNDSIVGASPRENAISTIDVLDSAFKTNHKKVREVDLFNDLAIIKFTRDSQVIGQETYDSGLALTHDGSFGIAPTIDYYFYRLVCENGASTEELTRLGTFSNRMDRDKLLERITAQVDSNLKDTDYILKESLIKMQGAKIGQEDRKYVKSFLNKKLDWQNHEDGKNQFDLKVKDDSSYFDLMNFITDFAKNFDPVEKSRIENLGGNMTAYFKPLKPTSEVFLGYSEYKRKKIHKELVGE